MVLSTRDMARLGLLMLRQGQWRGHQIIPSEWVRRSTSVRTPSTEMPDSDLGCGYLWWVWEEATGPYHGAYTATLGFDWGAWFRAYSAWFYNGCGNPGRRFAVPRAITSPRLQR
jgi:CubicO group peptidase (beta-lactamase class C family)